MSFKCLWSDFLFEFKSLFSIFLKMRSAAQTEARWASQYFQDAKQAIKLVIYLLNFAKDDLLVHRFVHD